MEGNVLAEAEGPSDCYPWAFSTERAYSQAEYYNAVKNQNLFILVS